MSILLEKELVSLALADIFFHSFKFTPGRSKIVASYLGTGMMEIGKFATSIFPTRVPSFGLLNLV